jgi:phosphohistidine phosphatase
MAKTLYLMRHAKSDWNTSKGDFARSLNTRGLRDAPETGRRLKARAAAPHIVLCSPAQRTRQTAALLDLGTEPIFDERIYEASVHTLLDIIQSLDDRNESAMLIGHNPSIAGLVNQLAAVQLQQMPTCAVATIEADADRWAEIAFQPARLVDFDYPNRQPEL